jgi:hypothetical protein
MLKASVVAIVSALAPTSLSAQLIPAPQVTLGVGYEELNGGVFRDRQKFVALAGVDVAWRLRSPAFTITTGVQLDHHYPPGETVCPTNTSHCAPQVPNLDGVRGTVTVHYASRTRGTVGFGVGGGYFASSAAGTSGSRFRVALAEWEGHTSRHTGFVARVERVDLPDFGGDHLHAIPVSIALRLR